MVQFYRFILELKVDSWIAMEIYNTRLKVYLEDEESTILEDKPHALSSSAISASLKVLRVLTESPIICTVSPISLEGLVANR